MKPIVLATDGSPSATEATLNAIKLARTLETRLVIVAVEHVAVPAYGYYGYAELVAELAKMEQAHVDDILTKSQAIAEEAGVRCDVVHATGMVAQAICTVARVHGAQMIVIGAHGWGSIARLWHGSVSTEVVHEAPCPVLVVPGAPKVLLETEATQSEAVLV
jgi:nucleotide-binding universal stress UspA family protein